MAERATSEGMTIAGVRGDVPMSGMTEFFGRAFGTAAARIGAAGLHIAGPAVGVYRTTTTDRFDVLAGFPVDAPAVDGLEIAELPAGEIVSHLHVGPYDTMAASYELLDEWCSHEDFDRPVISWEEYLDGPESSVDPAHWRTRIVYPLPSLTA